MVGKKRTWVGEVGFVAGGGVGDVFGGVLHFDWRSVYGVKLV